jgi:hypothetical protein
VNIYDKAPEVIQDEQQLDYVRMRVINVVKKWLHFNLNDFKVEELVASLNSFIRKMKATKDPKQRGWAEALQTAFDSTFTYKNTIERVRTPFPSSPSPFSDSKMLTSGFDFVIEILLGQD